MGAAGPAAGSALTFVELLDCAPDAAFAGLVLLGVSTQQMNSLRANGVMSCHALIPVALSISAARRSLGSVWTVPPETRLVATRRS